MKLKDFQKDDHVLYVPPHAKGNDAHPDCQRGIVSSKNGMHVFVRYYENDVLNTGTKATNPMNLRHIGSVANV